jgi:hypothetical protein
MSTIEDEGKSITDALAVKYEGPQYLHDDFQFHLFTDPLNGGTFAGTSLEDAKVHFQEQKARFNISQEKLPKLESDILRQFPLPGPKTMEIGQLEIVIPTPRGYKLKEGLVIRTDDKYDKSVEHLGYTPVSLNPDTYSALEEKGPTDIQLINESQNRLKEVKIIPDSQLNACQLANLNLARGIASEISNIPPDKVHAADIPPASDRVRTAGLYGTKSGVFYLSRDILKYARDVVDTQVHELGHHRQFTSTGEAQDLTPIHEASMKLVVEKLIEGLNSGKYDHLLLNVQY